ncbi:hypothetical protein JZ751_015518 [Albula glossodonta]|uniref:Uncharacterized protein n=1 Tax=Albula glossodonta TaxID=121402 RepID=A0A8T2N6V4_9TELE|nr:hypothetical protein JZ751_015518 [Albula glossodonta]
MFSFWSQGEELACRLPELEQPGSDQDNLDSETSMSCESLMDMRFGNAGAEDGTETSSAPPHQAPPDSQEPLGGCKDVVQSVGITPAKEPSPNNSDPAHKHPGLIPSIQDLPPSIQD